MKLNLYLKYYFGFSVTRAWSACEDSLSHILITHALFCVYFCISIKRLKTPNVFIFIGMSHVCTRDKIQKVERGGNSSSFFPSCSSTFQFLSLATAAAVGSFVLPKRLFDARPSTCAYVGVCIYVIPSFRLNFSILYVVPHPTFSQSIEIKHSCGHTEFTHSYSHSVYCCRNIP